MLKLKQVSVRGFWGSHTVNMEINEDITFIVGKNGSGKTTFINLISAALNLNIIELRKTSFEELEILFLHENGSLPSVKFVKTENLIKLYERNDVSAEYPKTSVRTWNERSLRTYGEITSYFQRDTLQESLSMKDEKNTILSEVRLSWLSVHRESLDNRRSNQEGHSTVDIRLLGLCNKLVRLFSRYASSSNVELSKFQEEFFLLLMDHSASSNFHKVLIKNDANILKEEKRTVTEILKELHVSQERITKMVDAFYDTVLPNSIKAFILTDTVQKKESNNKALKQQKLGIAEFDAIISSTKLRVAAEHWNSYLEHKNQILSLQNKFISLLNNMFDGPNGKSIYVNQSNELCVKTKSGMDLDLRQLSSGEKQMLILLGEALLQDSSSYIYITDEPELSLHVDWQSMLVKSILGINPNAQLVFATHSPDIVSEFSNRIKYMEDALK